MRYISYYSAPSAGDHNACKANIPGALLDWLKLFPWQRLSSEKKPKIKQYKSMSAICLVFLDKCYIQSLTVYLLQMDISGARYSLHHVPFVSFELSVGQMVKWVDRRAQCGSSGPRSRLRLCGVSYKLMLQRFFTLTLVYEMKQQYGFINLLIETHWMSPLVRLA